MLGHDITNYSSVGLPFLLAFFLEVGEEVIIWFEYWHRCYFDLGEWGSATQYGIGEEVEHTVLAVKERTGVVNHHWLYRVKTCESSFLEADEVSSIGSSSFSVDNEGWVQSLFTHFLSFTDFIKHLHPLGL